MQMEPFQVDIDGARVTLRGRLSEDSDLEALLGRLPEGASTLDLSGITRVNSYGVREWRNFIRAVPAGKQLVLEKCSVAFVNQLNMITDFAGPARIASVFVPYLCNRCDKPAERLVEIVAGGSPPTLPEARCACGGTLEPDVIEDLYFSFLK